jgi:hypothetical protein
MSTSELAGRPLRSGLLPSVIPRPKWLQHVDRSAEKPNEPTARKGGRMRRVAQSITCWMALCLPVLINPPAAQADDLVTYEVVSDDIQVANIEYEDITGRASNIGVRLPWREDVMVHAVRGAPPDGSQVRADWRPSARPSRWVTVRVIYQGKVICQNTLDVGDATCYGITQRVT